MKNSDYHMFLFEMILWFIIFSQLLKHLFALFAFQACPNQATDLTMSSCRRGMTSECGRTHHPMNTAMAVY